MKKIALICLSFLLVFSLAACRGNTEPEETQPTVPTTPATEPAPTIIPTIPDDIGPNVPDPSVDNGTLEDIIPDASEAMDGDNSGNGTMKHAK